MNDLRITPFGPSGLLVEFAQSIDPVFPGSLPWPAPGLGRKPHRRPPGSHFRLSNHPSRSFRTVTLLKSIRSKPSSGPLDLYLAEEIACHEIPVIYDGPDLAALAQRHKLSVPEIVTRHSDPAYDVYLVGFSPGFPYLGPLDENSTRRASIPPALAYPAGSVGIGGEHTGIYSIASPGGWWLIGRTDTVLFSEEAARGAGSEKAFLLRQGDRVKFIPDQHMNPSCWKSSPPAPASPCRIPAAPAGSASACLPVAPWMPGPPLTRTSWSATPLPRPCWKWPSPAPASAPCKDARSPSPVRRSSAPIPFGKASSSLPARKWPSPPCTAASGATSAVQGGFDAPRWFGSASVNPRARPGRLSYRRAKPRRGPRRAALRRLRSIYRRSAFLAGDTPLTRLARPGMGKVSLRRPRSIFRPNLDRIRAKRPLRLPPGRHTFKTASLQILSSPTAVGVIQIPSGGQPIVLLRDGPTVGGYPRLAILDSSAISRFTQCAPGTAVQFRLIE